MKNNLFLPVLAMILLCSCAPTRVVVEKAQYEDFKLSDYSTFGFAKVDIPHDSLVSYSQVVKLLKEEMTDEFASRGLMQDTLNPDFRINLGLVVADKVQTREANVTSDPFTYSGQRNYNLEFREIPVDTYREGSLTVHFVNTSGNAPVWIGTISEVVPKNQKDKDKSVRNAVDQIFKQLDLNHK